MNGYSAEDPKWASETMIDVILHHPKLGPIPFTAMDHSGEELMQWVWDSAIAGDFGPMPKLTPKG